MGKYAKLARFRAISECGVTANMPALGAGDSGFESLHSDKILVYTDTMKKKHLHVTGMIAILGISTLVVAGILIMIITRPQVGEAPQTPVPAQQSAPITVGLTSGQTIVTPLIVSGMVVGNWFFEGSFPVYLKDANGNQLGVGLASSTQDWMTTAQIPFTVTLPAVTYHGPGSVVFTKDNPSGEAQFDASYSVPVIFQ